jgi:hypothetical protein
VPEGYVPAVAVRRLLEQPPTAIGLEVSGMPAGSMQGGDTSAIRRHSVRCEWPTNAYAFFSALRTSDEAVELRAVVGWGSLPRIDDLSLPSGKAVAVAGHGFDRKGEGTELPAQ